MTEIILKAEHLSKTFQSTQNQNIEVMKNISLELERNRISVIIGASGAGKSTLLHVLSGLEKPDSGKVFINNVDLFNQKNEDIARFRNNEIGFVFQFHQLLPEFTALENVAIPQLIGGKKLKSAEKNAEKILVSLGLEKRLNNKPAELSGGEQQRVAVARALINNPSIIFADEPTGNLDSQNSETLHNLFLDLNKNFSTTFLIATHNMELSQLADVLYEMKDGFLVRK